ncbi:hypothetical protein [Pseudoalteromonas piscicida]|uniref:hypothetical protein n=1 Tax=Pseudoalteromonas piscicida TaxID=43662 RepID=UPI001CB6FC17|nr:hypothetical protein [Pseudoalteromonas piscicida]
MAKTWIAEVQQGDLEVSVSGYGQLKPKTPRLISAASDATVEEIVLRPGAQVNPDSIIMRLQDANLAYSLKDAKRSLAQLQDHYLQLDINQQRELLSHQADLEILRSELESAELEVSAQGELVEDGVVSKLDYQRAVLTHRQLKRHINIEQQRISQLQTLHKANLQLAQSNIDARNWRFNHPTLGDEWQLRYSELTIAGMQAHLVILTDVQAVVSQVQRDAWQKMIRILSHEIHNSLSPILNKRLA